MSGRVRIVPGRRRQLHPRAPPTCPAGMTTNEAGQDTLINEVAGHEERMKGPLWSKDGGEPDDDWTASLRNDPPASSEPPSRPPTYDRPPRPSPPPRAPTVTAHPDLHRRRERHPRMSRRKRSCPSRCPGSCRREAGRGGVSTARQEVTAFPTGWKGQPGARLLGAGRRTDGRMRPNLADDLRPAPTHPAPDATKDDCGGVGVPLHGWASRRR